MPLWFPLTLTAVCDHPAADPNSNITFTDNLFNGSQAVHACHEGYNRTNGMAVETATCLNNGTWDLEPTPCVGK